MTASYLLTFVLRGSSCGTIHGSFLDEDAIDEFIITVVPTLIGHAIPLIAPRHREVPLRLRSLQRVVASVVQLHYDVQRRELRQAKTT